MVRGMWSVCKWTGPGLMMMNTRNQLHNSAEIMSEHRTQPSSCSQTQYIDTSALLADYQSQHPSCDSETVKTWIVNAERYWVIITINRKHGKLRTTNILCGEHPPLMSPLCGLFLGLVVAGCLSLRSPLADSPDRDGLVLGSSRTVGSPPSPPSWYHDTLLSRCPGWWDRLQLFSRSRIIILINPNHYPIIVTHRWFMKRGLRTI